MTNDRQPRNREPSGSSPVHAFLTATLCLVIPASFAAFVVFILIAGLPPGLLAIEIVAAAAFAAIGLGTGLRQRKNRETAAPGAEGLFWAIMASGAAGSVLSFFVLDLETRARTFSGVAAALLFVAAAALYAVWARLSRGRAGSVPRPRSPRVV